MVAGQMADLLAERRTLSGSVHEDEGSLEELEAIHRRKTGALLLAPLRMGAAIAGAPEAHRRALESYGRAVGLAFQIVDDLLDVEGDEAKLGKRVGKDLGLGKWTYPRFPGHRRQPPAGFRTRRRGGCSAGAVGVTRASPPRVGDGLTGKGSLMIDPDSLLARIKQPADLKTLSDQELEQLAGEMRSELIGVVGRRSAHFASNLGVVELCLALHLSFDFSRID
jgi:hypothetical protein